MTDHQLARSTAEKCAALTTLPNHYVPEFETLILASYHERDRAATARCPACAGTGIERALGRDNDEIISDCPACSAKPDEMFTMETVDGEKEYRPTQAAEELFSDFCQGSNISSNVPANMPMQREAYMAGLLEASLRHQHPAPPLGEQTNETDMLCHELRVIAALQKAAGKPTTEEVLHTAAEELERLERALTALQESNREVVRQRDQWAKLYTGECMVRAGMTEKCNRAVAEVVTLRARLALADEMAKALEHTLAVFNSMADRGRYPLELLAGEKEFLGKQGWQYLTDALSRWTAPQAGTTDRELTRREEEALEADLLTPPAQPASRAVPITPETVVPFPCWLWHTGNWLRNAGWDHSTQFMDGYAVSPYTTHYHPDQPTAPTCRPTATEGGV